MAIQRYADWSGSSSSQYLQTFSFQPGFFSTEADVAPGSFLVLFLVTTSTADDILSVTDNGNNSWVKVGASTSLGSLTCQWWICASHAGGEPVITLKSSNYVGWVAKLRGYTGLATTNPVDVTATSVDSGFVQSHPVTSGATNQANELVLTGIAWAANTGGFPNEPSGYTDLTTFTSAAEIRSGLAEKKVSVAGQQAATWPSTDYLKAVTKIITIKEASSAAPSAPAAVTNLATTPGDTVVRLDWTDSPGATKYKVYRNPTAGSRGTLLNPDVPAPVGGRVSLPNFPLIFDDDFATVASEGSDFQTKYGVRWDAYPADYPTTYSKGLYGNSFDPAIHDHQGGFSNLSVVSGISGANGNAMRLRLWKGASGPVTTSCPEVILPGGTKFQAYGRYEYRMKADSVAGYYIAWLLWSEKEDQGIIPWPQSGENDFQEGSLNGGNASAYHHNYGGTQPDSQDYIDYGVPISGGGWHTYAIEWAPGSVKYYVDGVLKGTVTGSKVVPDRMRVALMSETNPEGTQPAANSTCNIYIDYFSVWSYQASDPAPAGNWLLATDPNITVKTIRNNYSGTRGTKLDYIINQPGGKWFGHGWAPNGTEVGSWFDTAYAQGKRPIFIIYDIPGRDGYGSSAGGAATQQAYYTWLQAQMNGVGNRFGVCVLEPDSIGLSVGLGATELNARMDTINAGIDIIRNTAPNVTIYLDNTHSAWLPPSQLAPLQVRAGVAKCNGINENVSNFQPTASCESHAEQTLNILASQYGITGKGYIVDSSRNGGTTAPAGCDWRNPTGRQWGKPSRYNPNGGLDGKAQKHGELWCKVPGESDGNGADQDCSPPPWPETAAGTLFVPWLEDFVDRSTIP